MRPSMMLIILLVWLCAVLTPVASLASTPPDRTAAVKRCAQLPKPIAPWLGRLVFSGQDRGSNPNDDVVSFVINHAADGYEHLSGKTATLSWTTSKKDYVRKVQRNVRFTSEAFESASSGIVVPTRLDQLDHVGPLESLAGSRPENDVTVMLQDQVLVSEDDKHVHLSIDQEPTMISGTSYIVVKIRRRLLPESDEFEVEHYNPETERFDGPDQVIRIPQVAVGASGLLKSSNQDIEKSPANEAGWYMYGNTNEHEIFVVEAIESRDAVSLNPGEVILSHKEGIDYIDKGNWLHTPARKGTQKTVLIDPTAKDRQAAISEWNEGDRCLLIHLFGGIGGDKGDESLLFGLVPGHFSYGIATVVRDLLTQELCFDIDYLQVYAHGPDGILSGRVKRFCYGGDLKRGWLGSRPISDIVVKLDTITQDYYFGPGLTLSPYTEFIHQLHIMMARYRVGDGTGASIVTPSRSCVQDSNQALYVALQRVEDQVKDNSAIKAWLADHPNDPETLRFQKLRDLGKALDRRLTPLGIVRRDWKRNVDGISVPSSEKKCITAARTLASVRTALPRRAHDEIAKLLMDHGAKLWFIRTNEIGGRNPDTFPLAPTILFGRHSGENDYPLPN